MEDCRQENRVDGKLDERKAPNRPTKLTFMDSLKVNLKKWSSHRESQAADRRKIVRVEPFKPVQEGALVPDSRGGVEERGNKVHLQGEVRLEYQSRARERDSGRVAPPHARKRRTSFEIFLASIPKLDPVDRTVGWVLKHPDLDVGVSEEDSVRSMCADTDCNTSISRYESERGTCGRGTPPSVIEGQPRLDDLFRQIQMKQEREAKYKSSHGQTQSGTSQTHGRVLGHRPLHESSPWLTHSLKRNSGRHSRPSHEMPPREGPSAEILHKNSYYYNQNVGTNENAVATAESHRLRNVKESCCEWETCQAKFLTVKDLHRHVHDRHLSRLPVNNIGVGPGGERQVRAGMLYCHWRQCTDSTLYSARYKLMLHLQRAHFETREDYYDREKRDPQKLQAYFQNTNSLEARRRGSNTLYTAAMTTTPYTTRQQQQQPTHTVSYNAIASSSDALADIPDPLSE